MEFDIVLGELSDENLSHIRTKTRNSDYWSPRVNELLDLTKETLTRAKEREDSIPSNVWGTAIGFANDAIRQLEFLRDYPIDTTPPADLAGPIANLANHLRDLNWTLIPYLRTDEEEIARQIQQVAEATERASELMAAAEHAQERATSALEAAQKVAADSAQTSLTQSFTDAADKQRTTSRVWLVATLVSVALFIAAGLWLLLEVKVSTVDTAVAIRDGILKVTILAALAFAIGFSSRNYRASRHMQTSYELRGAIVKTAQSLQESVAIESRDSVITAMVVSVFALGDTGHSGGAASTQADTASLGAILGMLRQGTPGQTAPPTS